jgi:glycosyltransferase involved in cell wall biosynthesis
MKILYHHRIASKDGQFVHVEELTRALSAQGHEVLIIGPSSIERDRFGSESGFVSNLKRLLPKAIYELLEFAYAIRAYFRLARAARRFQPHVLYERYNLFMPVGVWVKRKFGIPMLLEVNSPLFEERGRYGGIALKSLARWSERYTWGNADRVLPVTRVLAGHVMRAGVPEQRIAIIPNGIDPERFRIVETTEEAKRRLGLDGRVVLGFTGFVREWHGLEYVIDLLATPAQELRHFLIVGDGPASEIIRARARELGVEDRLTITGIVEREAVASYVAAFDIALQPDVVPYASPLKLFEYLAMGRAVIAPDSDNIREVLTNGVNGLLFQTGDKTAFAAAVEQLCTDTALRQRLAEEAVKTIRTKKLTWTNNAERVAEIVSGINCAKSDIELAV